MSRRRSSDPKLQVLRERGTLHANPAQVKDPLFLKGGFFDPRDLLQVKYEMLRAVQSEGQSVSEAAERFGLARPTFYKAREDFARAGLTGLLPARRGPHGPHKMTEEVLAFIAEVLRHEPALRAPALAERIESRFGRRVHPRTIERARTRQEKKHL